MGEQDHTGGISNASADSETIAEDRGSALRSGALFSPSVEGVGALLAENIGDYISLGLFAHILDAHRPATIRDVRGYCLKYLDHMICEEYVLVGTVLGTSFVPWVLGSAQLGEALAARWPPSSSADYDTLRDIAWLSNTAKGDAAARHYLQRRARSASRESLPSLPVVLNGTEGSRAPTLQGQTAWQCGP